MPRLTISPVRISFVASSTFAGVIRLPLPRWSSGPQRELDQFSERTGLRPFRSSSITASPLALLHGRRPGSISGCGAVGLGPAALPPLRGLNGEPDREDQHRAVEQRFDEE